MNPYLYSSAHISVHLSKRKTFRTEAVEIIETRIAPSVQLLRNSCYSRDNQREVREQQNH